MIFVDLNTIFGVIGFGIGIFILIGCMILYFWSRGLFSPFVGLSIDIFKSGTEGYHTFRIPAILTLPNNTIIVFCEGRKNSQSDFGYINMVMKRSTDNGKTWSKLIILWDEPNISIQNPTPIYISNYNRIILPVIRDRRELYILLSDDLGVSWTKPIKVNLSIPEQWQWHIIGPGHGLVLKSGRILLPANFYNGQYWNSHFIYSDNFGETWQIGAQLDLKTNECMAMELSDGSVYTTLRVNSKEQQGKVRYYAISKDGGISISTTKIMENVIDPVCQAAILHHPVQKLSIFTNPADSKRRKMTIKWSSDEGQTWRSSFILYTGAAGYSDLGWISDDIIACIFERGHGNFRNFISLITLQTTKLEKKTIFPQK